MANLKSLVISSGQVRQILDADSLVVGSGLTSAGSSDLSISAAGTNIDIADGKTFRGAGAAIFDWSGSTGAFSTSSGAFTSNASSNDFTNNIDASGGLDIDADNQSLTVGAGADLSLSHDGTNSSFVSTTGNFTLDNQALTGQTVMLLGTDTSATGFQVQNDSASALFSVDGSGQADFSGNVDATGGLDIDADNASLTIGAAGDLDLSHDGTDSVIANSTGNLRLNGATGAEIQLEVNGTDVAVVDSAGLTVTGDGSYTGNLSVSGNLSVGGTTTTVDSETVLISDNHLHLNFDYTSDAAQAGGLVVSVDPAATSETLTGSFVAGVASTTNITVGATNATGFAAGDIVVISGSTSNDGLYEVHDHSASTITLRGIGNAQAVTFNFLQNQVTAESAAGTMTQVDVSVLQAGTDGAWEVATGDNTGSMSFNDLVTSATAGNPTLQDVYDADPDGGDVTLTSNSTDGKVIYAGDQDWQFTTSGTLDVDSAADFSGGLTNSAGELLMSGGNMQFNDNVVLSMGTGDDFDMSFDGTNTLMNQAAGYLLLDAQSTTVDDGVRFRLGDDAGNTKVQIRNNSDAVVFQVNSLGNTLISGGLIFNGPDINLDPTGTFDLAMDAGQTVTFNLADNLADSLLVQEGANAYLDITTTDAAEKMEFGNGTTNPDFEFLGTGLVDLANGSAELPEGTSISFGGTTGDVALTGANLNTLVAGADSDADALHTHQQLRMAESAGDPTNVADSGFIYTKDVGGVTELFYIDGDGDVTQITADGSLNSGEIDTSQIASTGWDETGASFTSGEAAAINSAANARIAEADATSASGDHSVVGIRTDSGRVVHEGVVDAAFVASLTLTAGDRVWVSKTAGQLTNDVSAFAAGDAVIPMGYVRDATAYTGTGGDLAEIVLDVGAPVIL